MFAYLGAEGRILGFDRGDWALFLGAFSLVGAMILLST
jgi:hypothetical protein